jgi:hypothetical protein
MFQLTQPRHSINNASGFVGNGYKIRWTHFRNGTTANKGFAARLSDVITMVIFATIGISFGGRNSNRLFVLTSTLNYFTSFRTGLTEHLHQPCGKP